MIKIMYQPRMDDAVCVARFYTLEEALSWMEVIEKEKPKAFPHHYLEEEQ